MKNILVPIDGSRPSHNALQHAIDIANVYNAELTIVNITNADAVLDRIVHQAIRIELFGESLRKCKSKK